MVLAMKAFELLNVSPRDSQSVKFQLRHDLCARSEAAVFVSHGKSAGLCQHEHRQRNISDRPRPRRCFPLWPAADVGVTHHVPHDAKAVHNVGVVVAFTGGPVLTEQLCAPQDNVFHATNDWLAPLIALTRLVSFIPGDRGVPLVWHPQCGVLNVVISRAPPLVAELARLVLPTGLPGSEAASQGHWACTDACDVIEVVGASGWSRWRRLFSSTANEGYNFHDGALPCVCVSCCGAVRCVCCRVGCTLYVLLPFVLA